MSQPDYKLLKIVGSAPPPLGVTPNFTDPYSLETYSTVILSICLPILTLVLWIRLYTRFHIAKSVGWEDLCALLAWIGVVGYAVTGVIVFQDGVGSHQWDVTIPKAIAAERGLYASSPIYRLTLVFAKLAILLQLLRIFVPGRRGAMHYAIHALIWFNVLSHGAFILIALFQCTPVRKGWNRMTPGKCIDIGAVLICTAVTNVFSDFSVLLLPLCSVWQLQMPVKRKFGVSALFSLGLIACIASVVHLVFDIKSIGNEDPTWVSGKIVMSAYIELTTAVLCGCLQYMPQFFHHFVPKLRSAYLTLTSRSKWRFKSSATSTPSATNAFALNDSSSHLNPLRLDNEGSRKGFGTCSNDDEGARWI